MKKRIIATLLCMGLLIPLNAQANDIDGTKRINVTAYTADPTAHTASGVTVRKGICAGADKYLYDSEYFDGDGSWVAMVWTADGTEFLGYFEILDRGGTDAIRKGNVVDIFCDDYEECVEFMTVTGGKALVKYVKSVG